MREQYEHWLGILMMVSGFVLLIVRANVANLVLVHGMERRRQVSLSIALSAQPSRILRQPLTESILLSLFGGATGLAIAFAGTRLILHFAFPTFAGFASVPINASPSMLVLMFALVISLLTGVAFGMGPAWVATRVDPIEAREQSVHRPRKLVAQANTGCVSGGSVACLVIGSRTAHGRFAATGEARFRIRARSADRRHHGSPVGRLSIRSTLDPVPTHPRFDSKYSRRIFRGSVSILTAKGRRLGCRCVDRWATCPRS